MILAVLVGATLGIYICQDQPETLGFIGVNNFMRYFAPFMAICLLCVKYIFVLFTGGNMLIEVLEAAACIGTCWLCMLAIASNQS